jgi:hypothetical protein
MVNEKDILARLQAGESVQSIADELIDAINAANAKFRAEEEEKAKKLAEEKKKAEEKAAMEAKKAELAATIATSVMEYLALADPELVESEDEELTAEEVQKLLDTVIPFMSSMKNIQTLFPASPSGKPVITLHNSHADDADEIIKNFLTANML